MRYERIRFLQDLGAEFERLERSGALAGAPRRRAHWRRFRPLPAVAITLALAGGAVAAVVATRDDGVDTTGLFGAEDRVTVAEGTTRNGSEWLLSTGRMYPPMAEKGPRNFCVSLRVTGKRGPEADVYCGPTVTPGTFSGGLAEDGGHDSGLIFGTAPDAVASVSVIEGGDSAEFPTIDDDAGIPGRFFVADAGGDYRETLVVFRDETGRELHAPQPVMRFLRAVSTLR